MNLNELIGKRILMLKSERGWNAGPGKVSEFKICELSPSEKWVKVMDQFGSKYWLPSTEIQPIEVLKFNERPNI